MSWATPEWLQTLWGVPVLLAVLWALYRRRSQLMSRLGDLIRQRTSAQTLAVHKTRLWSRVVSVTLILLALAGPRWGWRWREVRTEGIDLVVALDTSVSMGAGDVDPSRMERAARELLDLSELMAGDRVGLVIFAGGAYPRMPLTVDYSALRFVARDSNTATLLARGSDLGAAIDTSMTLLDLERDADKAILIISDGEDHIGNATEAAARAADAGVHVYALGVGTPDGAPIPDAGGGFKQDQRGELVVSRLDEDLLKAVAEAGHGAYGRSVSGRSDLEALYLREIRGRLEGAEMGVKREKVWNEYFQWPLAAGLFILVLGGLRRPGRLRLPGTVLGLLAMAGLAASSPAGATTDSPELQALMQQQAASPDDLAITEQLGEALFGAGRFNEAHQTLTEVADRTLDTTQRLRARSNAGLAAYRSGRLTRAVEDWQRVLQDEPEHPAAAKNAAAVQAEIQRRLGQEPPPDQQQDGEQQEQDGQQQEQDDSSESQQREGSDAENQNEPSQDNETSSEEPQAPSDGTHAQADEPEGEPTEPLGEQGEIQPTGPQATDEDTGASEDPVPIGRAGEISPEEAQRLLDGVEEGTPRVPRVRHPSGGKDW